VRIVESGGRVSGLEEINAAFQVGEMYIGLQEPWLNMRRSRNGEVARRISGVSGSWYN